MKPFDDDISNPGGNGGEDAPATGDAVRTNIAAPAGALPKSARDRRAIAIRFLRSTETMGSLLLRCRGKTPEAIEARTTMACVLLMAKQDAPDDLVMTDAEL